MRGVGSSRILFVAPLLMLSGLAGCLGTQTGAEPLLAEQPVPIPAYKEIDPERLSRPESSILPVERSRVAATVGDVDLFLRVYRPDTSEPVPVILHSTPYRSLDTVFEGLFGNSLVDFFVPRGYAVAFADVRGFGDSEGCVTIWGPEEQQDQYDLVEHLGSQQWSSGKVGMIGASYPGTTPMEAAVMQPPSLAAIVAVAGLTDPYYDWHYGGVPNGESALSAVSYEATGKAIPQEITGGPEYLETLANGKCTDAPVVAESYRSDGLYTEYYEARNLSARVKNVQVPMLYTQGFTDGNVKPSQLLRWFNEVDAPKKGIFGQWAHQYPTRSDWDIMVHAWFDEHLKGMQTGVMEGPTVEVHTNQGTWRADHRFPSDQTTEQPLYLDANDMGLATAVVNKSGSASYEVERAGDLTRGNMMSLYGQPIQLREENQLVFALPALEDGLYLSGEAVLEFTATIEGSSNTLFSARLYEVVDGEMQHIVFGGRNAALTDSFTKYEPVTQGDAKQYRLHFQPREYIVDAGTELVLVLEPSRFYEGMSAEAMEPHTVTIHTGGDQQARLLLPALPMGSDQDTPAAAQ